MMTMARPLSVSIALSFLLLAGCATTNLKRTSIVVDDNGLITVMGRKSSVGGICSILKSNGADRNTHVVVLLSSNASKSLRLNIYNALVKGGFPTIALKQKKAPEAYITKDRQQETRKAPLRTLPR